MLSYSLAFQRIALKFMAPKLKPQRLHQNTGAEQLVKKARTMSTQCSMKDAFSSYADYLNNFNEKRERVVKASRDITMNSKKVIFQVHRLSKDNKDEVLEKAGKDLEAVREQHFARLMKELQGTDFWKLRRAYSPGVQEYVEAATFYKFCISGTLCTLDEINATLLPLSDSSLEPLQINILDYLLGLADLTGELMRMAISRISDGEIEFAQRICHFVRQIHRELKLVVPKMDDTYDMKSKMEVMLQSVIKIENACFSVHVRVSEQIRSEFIQSQMDSNTELSDGVSQPVELTPEKENELFLQSTMSDKNGNVYGLGNLSGRVQNKNKRAESSVADSITSLQNEFVSYRQKTQQQMTSLAQHNQQLVDFLQSQFPSFLPHLASIMMPPPPRNDGSGSSSTPRPDESTDF